jgi:hypothetical protein
MALYLIANGPSPTTAAQVAVTTGTAIKTMLQVCTSATNAGRIVEWGISLGGAALAEGINCELIETDVAATVTAHVAAGIVKYDASALAGLADPTALFPVGVALTGYTGTAEGTITATRVLAVHKITATSNYVKKFDLGFEPVIQSGKFLRIRVTAAAAVLAYTYVIVQV